MSSISKDPRTKVQLLEEIEELRRQLEEAEQALEAIRSGDVDALVVADSRGERIYTLTGAEHVYRVIVETMNEAAATVDADGTILYCNQRFCDLMKTPMQDTLGRSIQGFAARPQQAPLETLMTDAQAAPVQRRITLQAADGVAVPVLLSASLLHANGTTSLCLVASDLTELEESANSIRVLREHQQALEESESRFRTIFEASQDAIVITDDDGVYVQVNPAVETIFGLPPEGLIGRCIGDFVDDAVGFSAVWKEFLDSGSFRGEMPLTGVDGQVRHVDAYAVANILPGRHLAVLRDVTERKRAEKALQETNEQLLVYTEELRIQAEELNAQTEELKVANEELTVSGQALRESETRRTIAMSAGGLGAWETNLVTGRNTWDEQLATLMGIAPEQKGKFSDAWLEFVHPEDRPRVIEQFQAAADACAPYDINYRVRRADGEERWLAVKGQPLRDAGGAVVRMIGIAQDITARKQAEEALRESEAKYRTLFNSIDQGFCIIEVVFDGDARPIDYRFVEVNPAFEKQTGLRQAEGKLVRELIPNQESHWFETYGMVAVTGEPVRFVNEAKGLHRWYDVYAFRVGDPESRRVAVLFDDITQQRRTEASLRELTKTLETRVAERTRELESRARQLQKLALELSQAEDRERRRLAEILHDDLQQQLAAVKFHLGILSSRARGDAHIQTSAAQLDTMLKDAIETSRSLSHELSPAVMYHGDMGEIFEWLAHQIQTKHGMIVRVDPDGQIDVQSDALKIFLFKAVQEMLFNAVKHARVGEARVRLRRVGRCVCLCVSDRGRGFDPQELKQTAGFGLMSIRERIGLLGGRMKIHSVKGVGSRFIITVPDGQIPEDREQKAEDRRDPSSVLGPPSSGHILRVLIADDHEVVRHGLASLLAEAEDIELVGQAGNGREAVDMAYHLQPDVVIMDVAMPLMNGDEAARQILRHLPQTRIVALSMYEEAGAVERMHKAGAKSYILKTAPSEELLAAVRGSE